MGGARGSYSRSRSNSGHEHGDSAARGKRRRSPYRSPSRSRSPSEEHASESRNRHRRHTRSRSRSHHKRYRSRSRSGSYDRHRYESSRYDERRRVSRSPMSRRKRHTGDRERPRASRCLGVFGLSLYTQEQDLKQAFEKYGPVDDLQIVYDHQTGKSRGFAFIYMHNIHDAKEAKEMAAGSEIDGRPIRVDYSITERAHTPTPGVYLGKPTTRSGYRSERGRSPHNSRRYSRSRSRSRSRSHYRY